MAMNTLARLKKLQAEAVSLFDENNAIHADEAKRSFAYRTARFFIFVWRSFMRNRCLVRASSLAYTTLLALIPVLAVAISISTSLLKSEGGQKQIQMLVTEAIDRFAPQLNLRPEGGTNNREQIATVISSSIEKVQSGALGATAGIVLVIIAVSLLSSIENTMNDIWGVSRGRSWFTRIVYYWAVVGLGPILLLFALGLSAGPYLEATNRFTEQFPFISTFVYRLLPVLVLSFAFALFYFSMPNTKVEWRAALVGGLAAGLLLHLNNVFSSLYFGQVVRNSKLWGGLGSVPVFLVGLYFSWLILLFGAQVAYAFQNRRSYFQEKQADHINQRGREFVALRIMTLIGQHFESGERPLTACQIADSLSVPSRLISKILDLLIQTRLVVEVLSVKQDEGAFSPARPLEKISCANILDALRSGNGQEVATKSEPIQQFVRSELKKIQEAEQKVSAEITLKSLVQESLSSERSARAAQSLLS
jgi:membrane protein